MDIFDLFKLSTRMFLVRTSRTALTVLGMGVGIGVILFLFSFGYGLQKTLLEKITTSDSVLTLDVMEQKNGNLRLGEGLIRSVANLPGVREVSPVAVFMASGSAGEVSAEISASTVEENYFRLSGLKLFRGRYANDSGESEIVISEALANIFGEKKETLIGKELKMKLFSQMETGADKRDERIQDQNGPILEKNYRVVGIAEGKKNNAFILANTIAQVSVERFNQLKVRCQTEAEMSTVRESLVAMNLSVSALSDVVAQANKVFRFFQIVLLFFGVVALIVSAIGMFNTMTVTLMERTEEIGIMKSVGASAREISLVFLAEALIMGLLGGIVGILMGIGVGEIFNLLVNLVAGYLGGEATDLFACPAWFALLIFAFSGVVGLLTGFFPARRAGKINPLDALRYK